MIITCQECSTRFKLDESLLNPEGSMVRCSQCKSVFMASPPKADPLPPQEIENQEDIPKTTEIWDIPDEAPKASDPHVFVPDGSGMSTAPEGDEFSFDDLPLENQTHASQEIEFQWEASASENEGPNDFDQAPLGQDPFDQDPFDQDTFDEPTFDSSVPDQDPFDLDDNHASDFPWEEQTPEDKFSSYDEVLDGMDELPDAPPEETDAIKEDEDEIPGFDDIPDYREEEHDFNLPEFDTVEFDEPAPMEPESDIPAPQETPEKMAPTRPLVTPQAEISPPKPRGINAMVKLMMIACLLLTTGLIVHFTTPYKLTEISTLPMVEKLQSLIKGKPAPPISVKRMPPPFPDQKSVKGHFVKNNMAGDLFIITGNVENPSTIPYHNVQVMGSLFKRNKTKAVSQVAFCGNIIPEDRLRQGNITDISTQLEASQNTTEPKAQVPPGGTIPFMLVFSDLPKDLQNFTVKVVNFKK